MKRGSREIGNGEGISVIASRHVRHRYRIFQNFRLVDERKKLACGSEQLSNLSFSALVSSKPIGSFINVSSDSFDVSGHTSSKNALLQLSRHLMLPRILLPVLICESLRASLNY